MSAWGTNQMLRGGGLYRIRYTGKPLSTPVDLKATTSGITLRFNTRLNPQKALDIKNYGIQTWNLKRSSAYGSDRYNQQTLPISKVEMQNGGTSVKLFVKDIQPVDVMSISYDISNANQIPFKGTLQSTVHNLGVDKSL